VAKISDRGAPLPQGWARGIGIDDRRRPSRATIALCAEVVTISVSRQGELRLERVDCVFEGQGEFGPGTQRSMASILI
jgi:hypothetical protein